MKFFESASVVETLGSSYKLAFVAARKVDFGQLRMYEAHAGADFERRGLELQVFYSLEEAKLWLRGAPG